MIKQGELTKLLGPSNFVTQKENIPEEGGKPAQNDQLSQITLAERGVIVRLSDLNISLMQSHRWQGMAEAGSVLIFRTDPESRGVITQAKARLGELIQIEQEAGRLSTGGRSQNNPDNVVRVLSDYGLSEKESSRAQQDAIRLRQELGWSERRIAVHLDIPRTTIEGWLDGITTYKLDGNNGILALNTVHIMDDLNCAATRGIIYSSLLSSPAGYSFTAGEQYQGGVDITVTVCPTTKK